MLIRFSSVTRRGRFSRHLAGPPRFRREVLHDRGPLRPRGQPRPFFIRDGIKMKALIAHEELIAWLNSLPTETQQQWDLYLNNETPRPP